MSNQPPFGADTLAVPAYLAKGDGADDPGFQRWKQEHPNWFAAGTWTAAPGRPKVKPPVPGDGSRLMSASAAADLAAFSPRLPDRATLSVADFQRVAAEGQRAPQSRHSAPGNC